MRKIPMSFEFFPARNQEAHTSLLRAAKALSELEPEYVSVTYGAGGSTHDGTLQTVKDLQAIGLETVPHFSCVGAGKEDLLKMIDWFQTNRISKVVALRGDLPSGMGMDGIFRHASELVAFLREHLGSSLNIQVAAYPEMHPQAQSPEKDLFYFIKKVEAGANGAITQYFYNSDAYFDFMNRLAQKNIDIPVVPGIMPITNFSQLSRFSEMCGAEIPRWIRLRLASFGDDRASIKSFGEEVVVRLCQKLIEGGVPGLHFYTMNRAEPIQAIIRALAI